MGRNCKKLNIKQPDEKRIMRQHFRPMGERRRKAKMTFETEDDAWEFIKAHCLHDLTVYRCNFCGKYHIGHINEKKYGKTK